MAKPPVIISNGGIAEELAKGLIPASGENEKKAWKIIMRNVKELNEKAVHDIDPFPVARSLHGDPEDPAILWRLSNEKEHLKETGKDAH